MLYITFEDDTYTTWQSKDKSPAFYPFEIDKIKSVQASGDELEVILAEFRHLPNRPKSKVVTWYGDMAKFIVGNL